MLRAMKSSRTRRHLAARGAQVMRGDVPYEAIADRLLDSGLRVESLVIDVGDFQEYVERAGYAKMREYYSGGRAPNAREKYLEHYVSLLLLAPEPGQILIDVASMNSPFADVATALYGVDSYRQDLMFKAGVRGRTIGGDAADMPIPDEFVDHLSLHCSFEHFEGDADSRFIREAARVLKPGGKVCSLPLYTCTTYAIQTHVRRWRVDEISFEAGDRVYVADHWGPPFGRYYDQASFEQRVVHHLGTMRLRIFEVTNAREADPNCYLRYAMLIEKPARDS